MSGTTTTASAADQICELIEANYWDWEPERARTAIVALDRAGQMLLAEMYQIWAIHEEHIDRCFTSAFGTLADMAQGYILFGEDPQIAARFRDCFSEDLHPEQLAWMEAAVEAEMALVTA